MYGNKDSTDIISHTIEVLEFLVNGLFFLLVLLFPYSIAARNILLGLIFIFYILCKITKRDFSLRDTTLRKYILYFLLLSILSIIKANDIVLSIERLVSPILRYTIFYFIASDIINKNNIQKYINLIFSSSTLFIIYGIFDYYNGGSFLRGNGVGTLVTFISMLFITFTIYKDYKKIYFNFFFLTIALSSIFALYITYSRGAVLGLLTALVIWFAVIIYKNLDNKKFIIFLILLLLVVATISISFFPDNLLNKFSKIHDIESNWSLKTRVIMWESSISMIKENPFLGIGIGNFGPDFLEFIEKSNIEIPKREYRHDHPHNLFLFIGVEQGIFSLALFLLMYYKVYLMAFANVNRYKSITKSSLYGLVLIGQLSSLFIHSLVDTTVRYGHVGFYILIFIVINEKIYSNGVDNSEN